MRRGDVRIGVGIEPALDKEFLARGVNEASTSCPQHSRAREIVDRIVTAEIVPVLSQFRCLAMAQINERFFPAAERVAPIHGDILHYSCDDEVTDR